MYEAGKAVEIEWSVGGDKEAKGGGGGEENVIRTGREKQAISYWYGRKEDEENCWMEPQQSREYLYSEFSNYLNFVRV